MSYVHPYRSSTHRMTLGPSYAGRVASATSLRPCGEARWHIMQKPKLIYMVNPRPSEQRGTALVWNPVLLFLAVREYDR